MTGLPCLFLDRDGVVIEDTEYPHRPEDLRILENVIPLIKWAKSQGWWVLVASNQSGVARGKFTMQELQGFTDLLDAQLRARGAAVDHYYYCPFFKDGVLAEYSRESDLRKPKPGMFLQAMKDYSIDIEKSYMVGDRMTDVIELPGLRTLLLRGKYDLAVSYPWVFGDHGEVLEYLKGPHGS